MADFYGMPTNWPGRMEVDIHSGVQEKAGVVEDALLNDIRNELGDSFDPARFIPYVQMHEFEAILFSDPNRLSESLGRSDLSDRFVAIREAFSCPEEINDNEQTAPSKRILAICPDYKKVIDGTVAAGKIGLSSIRDECPHFNEWVCKLEKLGEDS
jgi:hypothetical protein